MPKIIRITISHAIVAISTGLLLGFSALGVGFSDSASSKQIYSVFVVAWKILNAPAGFYVISGRPIHLGVWFALQVFTSFLWANAIALAIAGLKAWHNKRLQPIGREDAPSG